MDKYLPIYYWLLIMALCALGYELISSRQTCMVTVGGQVYPNVKKKDITQDKGQIVFITQDGYHLTRMDYKLDCEGDK